MLFVTGWIGGDGNSLRRQSPEFLLVNLGHEGKLLHALSLAIAFGY